MLAGTACILFTFIVMQLNCLVASSNGETLVAAWITSRHGMKSIDYTDEFKPYFNATLQMTENPKGELTPHGLRYAKAVGDYFWHQYGKKIGKRHNCQDLAQHVHIIADLDTRDKQVGLLAISLSILI